MPDVGLMSFVTSLKSGHFGGSGRAAAGLGAVWAPAGTMAVAEMAPTASASTQRAKRDLRCIQDPPKEETGRVMGPRVCAVTVERSIVRDVGQPKKGHCIGTKVPGKPPTPDNILTGKCSPTR